ncbi:Uncharacterised protein [Salmonella enterica subsp. enterica serovar Typhi]|nr:Uncharacterised protein [Salmonella enterica subsp. enterica serovar Typhi]
MCSRTSSRRSRAWLPTSSSRPRMRSPKAWARSRRGWAAPAPRLAVRWRPCSTRGPRRSRMALTPRSAPSRAPALYTARRFCRSSASRIKRLRTRISSVLWPSMVCTSLRYCPSRLRRSSMSAPSRACAACTSLPSLARVSSATGPSCSSSSFL